MKSRMLLLTGAAVCTCLAGYPALADDGQLVRKSMSKAPGQPDTNPVSEAEHAFIDTMKFYVPSQASNGGLVPIEYIDVDGNVVDTRESARPLVGVYIYGPAEGVGGVGFVGHGKRDAYAAVSLDDGNTWKSTNLSESADQTSCDSSSQGGCSVTRNDIDLFDDTGGAYPGDVINIFQATAGNNALVVWPSRYCQGGSPGYSLDKGNPEKLQAIADYMGIQLGPIPVLPGAAEASPDDLYLLDMYGVAGSQDSVDYAEDRFPQNQAVGEVPYACLWAARGTLVQGDDPRTDALESSFMRWFKAERLTSGRRDVNRIEAKCAEGAGCVITWQEDPDGLRGGQGLGPGEGWSGAVAHSQTDVWYSYIEWQHFNLVEDPDDDTSIITLADFESLAAGEGDITQKPQVGIPFAMPMRVTDNAKCNVDNPLPYCNGSFIAGDNPDVLDPLAYGLVDMCADTVEIATGGGDGVADLCVTEYGLPLVGNVAATRPRVGLFSYDSGDKDDLVDSAFVVIEAEESKGLGAFGLSGGEPCNPDTDEGCVAFDEGKNLWYYSFNMELRGDDDNNYSDKFHPDSLLANLAGHGNQLNQPEVDWMTGEFYPVANTSSFWGFGDYDFEIWNTEIARRGSLLAQSIEKATSAKTKSRLIALPAWKQGIMNQGGPADVMVRRIIAPKGWNVNDTDEFGNPYAFRNMECSNWMYRDGSNPHYPEGLCMDSAINLSGYIPDTCTDSATGGEADCPTVTFNGNTFGVGDTNPVLQGNTVEPNQTKVLTWHQCPADFTTVSASDEIEVLDCGSDLRTDDSTLADQSWYNPLDVAKGHRGFLDGDFVMMLYAWSPNWRLNAKGSDRYELYIRRSFDGARTWTTLPKNYKHVDNIQYSGTGTTTCETYRSTETGTGNVVEPRACNEYDAGALEQARNVTQLKSMKFTTLDPRYAPTAASITSDPFGSGYPLTDEDERDPSRYAIVYETGDNSTVEEGEAEPLDLFYSRAVQFGDHYQVWAEEDTVEECYPSMAYDTMPEVAEELVGSGFCNEFDQLDQGTPGLGASEASLEANPGGEFIYGVWAQWLHGSSGGLAESDAMARRIWYIDDYVSENEGWVLGGGSDAGGQ